MSGRKISEIADFPGKELAKEIEKRGIKIWGANPIRGADALFILGLIQVVAELRDEVAKLKEKNS